MSIELREHLADDPGCHVRGRDNRRVIRVLLRVPLGEGVIVAGGLPLLTAWLLRGCHRHCEQLPSGGLLRVQHV